MVNQHILKKRLNQLKLAELNSLARKFNRPVTHSIASQIQTLLNEEINQTAGSRPFTNEQKYNLGRQISENERIFPLDTSEDEQMVFGEVILAEFDDNFYYEGHIYVAFDEHGQVLAKVYDDGYSILPGYYDPKLRSQLRALKKLMLWSGLNNFETEFDGLEDNYRELLSEGFLFIENAHTPLATTTRQGLLISDDLDDLFVQYEI